MDIAIILTQEETRAIEDGDKDVIEKVRTYANLERTFNILGKDEEGVLYDISSEVLPPGQ